MYHHKVSARPRGLRSLRRVLSCSALVAAAATVAVVASSPAASAAGKPIVIGAIAGTTGAYGTTGVAVVNGAKMAVNDINAKGGVLGRKLSLVSGNDDASATTASQLFEKFVSEGAVAIDGSPDTGPATAALAGRMQIPDTGVVDDAGLTIYPHGPSAAPLPWVWSFGLNTFAWGQSDADYAMKNCPKGLAVLHDPTTYGGGGNDAIELAYKQAGKKLALDDSITENWSTGATVSLNTELQKIKSSGAQCVVVWLTPQDTAAFTQAMHTAGDHFTVIGNDEVNADNTFSKLAGKDADGTIGALITSQMTPSPALKKFEKRYQQEFHVGATAFAEASYDSIVALAQVIAKEKSTSPAALQKGLNSLQDFHGLVGTFSFSAKQHATIQASELTTVKYNGAKGAWLPLKG